MFKSASPTPELPAEQSTQRPTDLPRNPLQNVVITIDGPTCSGKGTLAKKLSRRFRMKYLDTGSLYRALTYAALQGGVDVTDTTALVQLAGQIQYDFKHVGNNNFATFLADVNIEPHIRTPLVDRNVHHIATNVAVREAIKGIQIGFAQTWRPIYGVILDGRDTGGRIYPEAQIQLFIAGDAATRAHWRYAQQLAQGQAVTYDQVFADLQTRDAKDSPNTIQTATAHVITATALAPDQVEQAALAAIAAQYPHTTRYA